MRIPRAPVLRQKLLGITSAFTSRGPLMGRDQHSTTGGLGSIASQSGCQSFDGQTLGHTLLSRSRCSSSPWPSQAMALCRSSRWDVRRAVGDSDGLRLPGPYAVPESPAVPRTGASRHCLTTGVRLHRPTDMACRAATPFGSSSRPTGPFLTSTENAPSKS